jgi:hypothetical protein
MSRSAQEVGPFDPAGLPGVGPPFRAVGDPAAALLAILSKRKGLVLFIRERAGRGLGDQGRPLSGPIVGRMGRRARRRGGNAAPIVCDLRRRSDFL